MTGPPRWLRPVGVVAAEFTTLCCIGATAALSLATSVGAGFMTRDSTLRPILLATLFVTIAGSALTFWHHRNPGPLIATVLAGGWIYSIVYLVDSGAHGDHGHHHDAARHAIGSDRRSLVWLGLALLVAAQLWDVLRIRQARRPVVGRTAPAE